MSDEMMKDLIGRYAASVMEQQMKWFNSPFMVAAREKRRLEWEAKPWYERTWITAKSRIRRMRERLGEIVAGRSFDD